MKVYRTKEQFESIVNNCINGNWQDAADYCVEYGFWANDLIKMNEEAEENYETYFEDKTDIAIVVEKAMQIRAEQGYY